MLFVFLNNSLVINQLYLKKHLLLLWANIPTLYYVVDFDFYVCAFVVVINVVLDGAKKARAISWLFWLLSLLLFLLLLLRFSFFCLFQCLSYVCPSDFTVCFKVRHVMGAFIMTSIEFILKKIISRELNLGLLGQESSALTILPWYLLRLSVLLLSLLVLLIFML